MRMMKILILGMFLMLVLFVQSSPASLAKILPESSHYQGYTYYNIPTDDSGNLRGRIDFAVYDTQASGYAGEQKAFTEGLNKQGRYVYAYQIFNDYEESEKAVSYFAVFGLNGGSLSVYSNSIDCADDSMGGVKSGNEYFTASNKKGVWEFNGTTIEDGKHSWFLVFSSDKDWVKGDYEMKSTEFPVPEPTVMALFGLASMIMYVAKKKRI